MTTCFPPLDRLLGYGRLPLLPGIALLLCTCGPAPDTNPQREDYVLVWADEFDGGERPDATNWSYEHGLVRNEEDQYYQEDNATLGDGYLLIEGRKEDVQNTRYAAGSNDWRRRHAQAHYTSSSINTRGKHAWRYGRFEMRGKIPVGEGIWPAWWTLGVDGGWPGNGEIDIMEYYDGKLLANIACEGPDGRAEWYSNTFPVDSLGGAEWAGEFHTWRMDWDSTAIALYLDDVLLNQTPLDSLQNKDGSGINPFHQPHYMLLNLALGGVNGGPLDATPFPVRYLVDYVRVYRRE